MSIHPYPLPVSLFCPRIHKRTVEFFTTGIFNCPIRKTETRRHFCTITRRLGIRGIIATRLIVVGARPPRVAAHKMRAHTHVKVVNISAAVLSQRLKSFDACVYAGALKARRWVYTVLWRVPMIKIEMQNVMPRTDEFV